LTRLVAVALVLAALVLAACGERTEPTGAPAPQRLTVLLDWLPNADHAPIYAAQASGAFRRAGLDVRIQTPSDASTATPRSPVTMETGDSPCSSAAA